MAKCGEKGSVQIEIEAQGLCEGCRENLHDFVEEFLSSALKVWMQQTGRNVTGVVNLTQADEEVFH